jgi:hypothetical protein
MQASCLQARSTKGFRAKRDGGVKLRLTLPVHVYQGVPRRSVNVTGDWKK